MVLQAMLQRLYRSVMRGPGLNARPHSSRQRIDLLDLHRLQDTDPAQALDSLLENGRWQANAQIEPFAWPSGPMTGWSSDVRERFESWKAQDKVLKKLQRIAGDARDFAQDHGESALALGFPLLSIPKSSTRQGFGTARVLAPLALVPVDLQVRGGNQAGITISRSGEGDDLLVPNPSLLAYLESQSGEPLTLEELDDEASLPWQELAHLLDSVIARLPKVDHCTFQAGTSLQAVPNTDALPTGATILPCAVLGLFPTRNLGLLRDTQWMIEEEQALTNPVKSFLDPQATEAPKTHALPQAPEWSIADQPAKAVGAEADLLVTAADPCQAEAVRHARSSSALVVHGPPGTGKSQTISNIIGDHLARGERVLFVCEKRTALDVVKIRLDAMGLGHLCGVIHDPTGDRRSFYMSLRERLETLAGEPLPRNPEPALKRLNERLQEVRAELLGYYHDLHHHGAEGERSFHESVGHWLGLHAKVANIHPDNAPTLSGGYRPEDLESHQLTLDEVLRRATRLEWPNNAWRQHPPADLSTILATSSQAQRKHLEP